MKNSYIIIIILIGLSNQNCNPTFSVPGRFSNVYAEVAGEELRFGKDHATFEYYSRTEGNIKNYSTGSWTQNSNQIFLKGFNYQTIDILNIEKKVDDSLSYKSNRIAVQFNNYFLDNLIKIDLVLNGGPSIRINKDTIFYSNITSKTIQVKAYIDQEGFIFVSKPKIDTLHSSIIHLTNPFIFKNISVKFEISLKDFYRTILIDTLKVKNSRTLIWNNRKFRKI